MVEPIVAVHGLEVRFPVPRSVGDVLRRRPQREIRAVDGVTFQVAPGEVMALVGESGSGKTTTALTLLGHVAPVAGTVSIGGRDLGHLPAAELRRLRRTVQVIMQDPFESLNPRMSVGRIVAEPLEVHGLAGTSTERDRRVAAALRLAELEPVELFVHRRPDQLSGGQRQRVAIAAALVLEPRVLVADEPVSMLDVSIRAEILNLLARLARQTRVAVLMITHDLATVAAYSDRVGVMYLGRLVELGPTDRVLQAPAHPYTRALVSVVPTVRPVPGRRRTVLMGEIPDASQVPSGCRFHPRCPAVFEPCPRVDPPMVPIGDEHEAACLLHDPASVQLGPDAPR
jgi:oligopeptide/dipeptide ABC transporter ATP-binding protein